MELYRDVISKLRDWKAKSDRKPLIIKGVRHSLLCMYNLHYNHKNKAYNQGNYAQYKIQNYY